LKMRTRGPSTRCACPTAASKVIDGQAQRESERSIDAILSLSGQTRLNLLRVHIERRERELERHRFTAQLDLRHPAVSRERF
jgi:hypothetical protein